MDSGHYDFAEARLRLDKLTESRENLCSPNSMLAGVAQAPWPEDVKVMELGVPKVHRLVSVENGDAEEMVFRLPGILVAKELPPIEKPMGKNTKAKYLKQSVTVAGLGNSAFTQSVQALSILDAAFGRWLGTDNIQPNAIVSSFRGNLAIQASNRYFTPALLARAGDEPIVDLEQHVDPKGILRKLAGDEYVHLSENQVIYTTITKTEHGKDRYNVIPFTIVTKVAHLLDSNLSLPPRSFQLGDIVELLVSVLAVKVDMRTGKYRMVCTLRAISLLDGSISEIANIMKLQATNRELHAAPRLKRRLNLSDNDEDSKRMREE
ncbi:hypothetical protein VNI00_018557 [Paramarasmius palmivorus]|uniref:Uncharacterized protein n=1 Tax=Paramarasmius palmivorus TaxID=297713 RepID=A0AAW0AZ91_9AGAR